MAGIQVRLKQTLVYLLSITLVTACSSIQALEINTNREKISAGDNYGELSNQGRLRTYYLYKPKTAGSDRPMPLVLVFHGDGGSGHSIAEVSRFNNLAEQKGFIVVYPDAINHKWSLRAHSQGRVDDVSFVTALIDHLQGQINIDSRRIYATGFSRGGILTQALACKLPEKISAFASVAGSLPVRLKPSCQPNTPVSMLMINGTNDRDVQYEGDDTPKRGALVSVPETVNFWRKHNQCTEQNQAQHPDPNPSDRIKVKTVSSNCQGGSEVLLASVTGGGHFWPGGASSDESLNKFNAKLGFNASETIWDFFERHKLLSE